MNGRHSRTAPAQVRRHRFGRSGLLRLAGALLLGAFMLGAAPEPAGTDGGEAPTVDLEALERLAERTGNELEQLVGLHNAYFEAMERLFDCVPTYSRANFLERVIEGTPDEVADYLRRIDFDPMEFDVVARHCLFPSRSLAVRGGVTGQYVFSGKVNGVSMRFVVDTGAEGVVVSAEDAWQAGLVRGRSTEVETVGGRRTAFRTVIDRLELGPKALLLERVEGLIVPDHGGPALFGTPYLGGFLDMRTVGPVLFLQAKRLDSDAARRVSQAVRVILAVFHVLRNECGEMAPSMEAAMSCLSVDPGTGRALETMRERIRKKYARVFGALQLD